MVINLPQGQLIEKKRSKREQKSSLLLLKKSPEELRTKFFELNSPRDVAKLLGISYGRLVYHIYIVSEANRYKTFEIPKRSGGVRQISTPRTALKIIQWKLNQVLQAVYKPKPSAHGFVPNKNIVTNAQAHSKKRYVLNLDLKDFFPSVNFGRVRGMFMGTPYSLNANVATVLAQICCHNNQLPQGAPTSPIITNMICAKMDSQLQHLAKSCKATYTRYADDITFSTTLKQFPESLARVITEEGEERVILGEPLLGIIAENGFEVNEQKIRLQTKGNHQEVTGLTTNQFPNVDRRFVRQIRAMLHAWQKFGLEAAEAEHRERYRNKANFPGKSESNFKEVLRGKIEFIGMVKGRNNEIYQKYLQWYVKLLKFGSN
ncbi:RNA-directed DNA polymerase [Halothece sp. PCC 7418]|uniref:reverse transcriptase domain-containing protein n=1 Tax=Halothece sp. (strain PCC 7418) TaxID=65093 RepID=UPI0002A085E2|nr:reverse transcriptase domain-containing protein [Halothece sp. PCC 7418]AFZ44654.1 RNA-directed DNA polymerase [Halothece sp. PCC 7418]